MALEQADPGSAALRGGSGRAVDPHPEHVQYFTEVEWTAGGFEHASLDARDIPVVLAAMNFPLRRSELGR